MRGFFILVAPLIWAAPILADTVAFDSTLASPNFPPPVDAGWYFDSNPQGGFTVDTGGTTHGTNPPGPIETGLRARQGSVNGGIINSATSTYTVVAGTAWFFDLSIDLRPGDVYDLNFKDVTTSLTISDDTAGSSMTIDPTTFWTDQEGWNNSSQGKNAFYSKGVEQTGDWGMQDSKSLSTSILGGYDVNAPDDYTFTLTVDEGMTQLSSDAIHVDAVAVTPLPSSASGGLAILSLLWFVPELKRLARRMAQVDICASTLGSPAMRLAIFNVATRS